jgi:hypothetical protein
MLNERNICAGSDKIDRFPGRDGMLILTCFSECTRDDPTGINTTLQQGLYVLLYARGSRKT